MNELVSVIIPVIYRPDLVKVCLDSIIKYSNYPLEIIVVWEGEDQEIGALLTEYKEIKVLHNPIPKGFAGAMNTGARQATGEYLCFLNSDTVATPDWLGKAIEAFEDKQVGLVSPVFTEMGNRRINKYTDKFEYVSDAVSLKGVCFIIPRTVLDTVGLWDESFGLGGGDDNDMCIRIKNSGFKLVVAHKSYIYHYGSASFRVQFNNDVDYSKKFAIQQFNKLRRKYDMKNKPSVFIAVPCSDGMVHNELVVRLIEWSHSENFTLKIKMYPYLSPLDNARNRAVKDFLEEYCDYFLHIDDDIIPPPNALKELLVWDKPVIAPLCFTFKTDDDGIIFPMPVSMRYDENKQYKPYIGTGVEEVDAITGGMHLIKREVFEKIERPYYFTYHKNGIVIYSEDFVFSQQCQKLGYKLYTHFGLLCKHYRIVDVKGINDLMVRYGKKP